MRIDRPDDADERDEPDLPDLRRLEASQESPAGAYPSQAGEAGRGEPDVEPDAGQRIARALDNRTKVDAAVRAYAIDQGYKRVSEIEKETVTPAMLRIEAEDPDRHLAGLENRLKGKDRLAEKVGNWMSAQPDLTFDQAFALVKDAIRYTFVYDEQDYAAGVYADCDRLARAGFERRDRENSWEGDQYKGINGRWREPNSGVLFEVQFHTQASLDAKEETHRAYERIRDPSTPADEVRLLRAYQHEVCSKIPIPPAATEIPDYKYM